MKFVFLMFVLTFFLATSSLSSFVSASSAGAGTCNAAVAAVQNMPGSSNVQTLGYGVSFGSSTSYTAGGGNVALTISGSGNYTGFLIYATTSSGTRVGTWTTANGVSQIGSSVACSTDASVTTHTSANPKPVSTVHSWVPPTTSSGPVTFNVVVMLANRQFQVYTQTLSDSASSTTAPPAGSTTSTPGAAAASFVSSPVLSLAALLVAVIAVAFARV